MSEDSPAAQLEDFMALAVSSYASPDVFQPRLLPGRIPEDFPLPMPVPPHSRLLGTVARGARHYVIMLQCDLPLNEAVSLYRTHFAALHWRERGKERVWTEQQSTDESVQSDVRPAVGLTLWHTASGSELIVHNWLTLMEREDATTLVRMQVLRTKDGYYANAQPKQPEPLEVLGPPHRAVHLLPTLFAPVGAQLLNGESHVDPVEVEMTAEVTTPLDPSALSQHYTMQLMRAWDQTEAGGTGPFVWTMWQFTSTDPEPAPWSALFLILKMPDQSNHYTLKVWAFRAKPEARQ